jgi:1,5-anhydro-D-fructose reductase (1,5-anhydro-D-mannitol-forming)
MISQITAEFGFSVVATTLRWVISASANDWGATAWSAADGFVEARHRPALEIYDRVGGGDSFASGLIYGLLTTGDLRGARVQRLFSGLSQTSARKQPTGSFSDWSFMTTLRWGLVGASDIAATRVIPAMRRLGHSVAGIWSTTDEHAAEYSQQHEIPYATSSLDELLSRPDIDAVYVSTINRAHYTQTLSAAAAGKHVLCEKPVALTLPDAWAMVRDCDAAGVVFGVNHHLPCAATHREIRRLVTAGAVGRPLGVRVFHAVHLPQRLATWRLNDPAGGAGVPLDITVHDAAVVNRLLGEPHSAVASGVRQGPWDAAVDDAIMSALQYEGDVLVQTHDAFTVQYAGTGLEVHGTDGSIFGRDVMTQDPVGSVVLRDANGERELDIPDRRDLYEVSLEAFARAVEEKAKPAVTGVEGVRALAVALAVQEAAQSGLRVPINVEPVEG